jgi:hypothetical protein
MFSILGKDIVMKRGLSFYICFGKFAGFHVEITNITFRVVLGWISFAILFADIEVMIDETIDALKENKQLKSRFQMADILLEKNLIKTAEEYSNVMNKGTL